MKLVTVSDDRYRRKEGLYGFTQNKITAFFEKNKMFGIECYPWTWADILKTEFYQQNKTLLDHPNPDKNGRAYKAYVIYRELQTISEGDFLIYNDCSPELWDLDKMQLADLQLFDLNVITSLCARNRDILTSFIRWSDKSFINEDDLGKATHANFTTNRCMDKMGLRFYEDAYMHAGGMWCIKKTPATMALIQTWMRWNCIDECCTLGWASDPDDYSFWIEEYKYKMGIRSDQSISGLLLAEVNQKFIVPPVVPGWPSANFLNFCRTGFNYKFLESNPKIVVGNRVMDKTGRELRVWRIENGIYSIGERARTSYTTTRENLKLIKEKTK
jgi:hypothetical protein